MRVLMLAQFFPPIIGGEERHVKALSDGLAQRGHDVSVATIRHGDDPPHEVLNGVRVHRLQGTLQRASKLFAPDGRRHAAPFPDPELMLGLHRIIAAEQPDIVHAHNWMVHSFLPLKPAQRAGLVVTLHDYSLVCAKKSLMHSPAPATDASPCTGPALARCLPCASAHFGALKGAVTTLSHGVTGRMQRWLTDAFIAVSSAVASRCGLEQHATPHSVIPNFVPDDIATLAPGFEPYLDQLPKGDFLLFVGDLMQLKGIDTLLAAYARLADAPRSY